MVNTLRYLFYYGAILNLFFGIAFLLLPQALGSAYGATVNDATIVVGRYFGAALLPLAYLAWIGATAPSSPLKLALVRTVAATQLIDIVVAVLAISSGTINTTGGILNVVLAAISVVGFGYYGFVKTEEATRRQVATAH